MEMRLKKGMIRAILGLMAAIGGICGMGFYILWRQVLSLSDSNNIALIAETISKWVLVLNRAGFHYWVVPGVVVVFLLFGLLISWIVSVFMADGSNREARPVPEKNNTSSKKDFLDQKLEQERRRRLFLHSLSILQREGRLLDFFDEDLSRYEDAQIGAAVRSIQEDCKKAVKKYIDPKPVLEGGEGDAVTVEDGFDIDAITLVGNVAGQPPFKGVIRHPGWKAGKKEVPKLSDIQDPGIMTPAEVEIR